MIEKTQKTQAMLERRINSLISKIPRCFPSTLLESEWQIVRNPAWVDGGRLAKHFVGKAWTDVLLTSRSFPSDEIIVNLSPMGMACYLPYFMITCLQKRSLGWFEEMLLPVGFGLEDVVSQFSGFGLEDLGYALRDVCHDRVAYAKRHLTAEQRECVAQYIEIAETNGFWDLPEIYQALRLDLDAGSVGADPKRRFYELLKKYTDFWRNV